MSESRVHHCSKQIQMAVEEDRLDAPTGKCRCRKYISIAAATKIVERGDATWLVTKRTPVLEDVCQLCGADPEVKNCANCHGTGKQDVNGVIEEYGTDIVQVSRPDLDEKKRKHRMILLKRTASQKKPAIKTPRTPTIEANHILRAYVPDIIQDIVKAVDSNTGVWDNENENGSSTAPLMYNRERTTPAMAKAARKRIEDYGDMILEARAFIGPLELLAIKPEPLDEFKSYPPGSITFRDGTKNKSWYWTVEGRSLDYGRAIQ